MNLHIELPLDGHALRPFRAAWKTAVRRQRHAPIAPADALAHLRTLAPGPLPDYLHRRLGRIPELVDMLEDPDWPLPEADRAGLLGALAYFCDTEDLIPDDNPRFGLLDDAIVLDLALQASRHEWLARCEYLAFCAEEATGKRPDRQTWMRLRRERLAGSMRRRRPASHFDDFASDRFHRETHSYLES